MVKHMQIQIGFMFGARDSGLCWPLIMDRLMSKKTFMATDCVADHSVTRKLESLEPLFAHKMLCLHFAENKIHRFECLHVIVMTCNHF